MKPTKSLFVTAALILGAMGAQAADFVQNGNYLTVQLKQHQNYGPSQIRLHGTLRAESIDLQQAIIKL